jgi:hypothetical protein
LKAKYRTSIESWGVMDQPFINVEETELGFRLTGYRDGRDVDMGTPVEGIADVLEFELFNDEE